MIDLSAPDTDPSPDDWQGVFTRIGSELRRLAGAVNGLQHFLTPLLPDIVGRDPDALTRLQDLDRVEQSLHGLSELMSCLDVSTALTDVESLSIGVKTIRLAGLAGRLSPVPAEASPIIVHGDLDLF